MPVKKKNLTNFTVQLKKKIKKGKIRIIYLAHCPFIINEKLYKYHFLLNKKNSDFLVLRNNSACIKNLGHSIWLNRVMRDFLAKVVTC